MEIINHYSILWGAVILIGVVAVYFLRKGDRFRSMIVLLGVAVVLLIGWLVFRPEQASTAEYAQFQSQLGQGQIVLLELQSLF